MANIVPTESSEKYCATSEKQNTKSAGKPKPTKDTAQIEDLKREVIVAQVEYLESYISEIGSPSYTSINYLFTSYIAPDFHS